MFYSLLILNPRSCLAQREIQQPYEMHRTLMRAFSGAAHRVRNAEDAAGVLFRVEEDANGRPLVLVQSNSAPDWSVLPDRYLAEPPRVKARTVTLSAGERLAFRLRANPTRRLGASAGPDAGKRIGIYDEAEQRAWLARKGEQHGFSVLDAQVSRDTRIKNAAGPERKPAAGADSSPTEPERHHLTLLSVQFDGVLEVTDVQRLEEALACGIGSAKGFGFGLLSLARPG